MTTDESQTPDYQRVCAVIRARIADGTYAPGARLPSLSKIEEELGVKRGPARQAYATLVAEGTVEGRERSGYFVPQPVIVRDTAREWYRRGQRSAFKAAQRAAGRQADVHAVTTVEPASEQIAGRLGIAAGAETVRSDLQFFADGEPTHISTSWEPRDITGGTPVELPEEGPHAGWGVVDRMDVIGWHCIYAIEKCTARAATPDEAQRLKRRPGSPVIQIERTHYATKDDAERAVETATIVGPEGLRMIYRVPVKDAD